MSARGAGTVDAAGFSLPLATTGLSAGQPVTVGVRPEEIIVRPNGAHLLNHEISARLN